MLSEIVLFYFQLCPDTLLDMVFLSNEEKSEVDLEQGMCENDLKNQPVVIAVVSTAAYSTL